MKCMVDMELEIVKARGRWSMASFFQVGGQGDGDEGLLAKEYTFIII